MIKQKLIRNSFPALLPTLQLADILVGGERVYDRISNDHQLSVNEKSKPIIIKIITRDKDIFRKPMYLPL